LNDLIFSKELLLMKCNSRLGFIFLLFQLSKKYEHGILKYVIFDQQLNNRLIVYLNLQACKQGLLQHLEHLLFYGVDMDVQNANGNTAIHVCALHNQVRL
jgi:ankyrin repeat protein